jgi:hypothetical protein
MGRLPRSPDARLMLGVGRASLYPTAEEDTLWYQRIHLVLRHGLTWALPAFLVSLGTPPASQRVRALSHTLSRVPSG